MIIYIMQQLDSKCLLYVYLFVYFYVFSYLAGYNKCNKMHTELNSLCYYTLGTCGF